MKILAILFLSVLFTSCGGGSAKVDLSFKSATTSRSRALAGRAAYSDLGIASTAGGEGLESFKMYFRAIQICQGLTESGSGYSNPTGCVTVYENNSDPYTGTEAPTAADRTLFDAAGVGKFFDILSSSDRSSLAATVSFEAGTYNYGIIETHPWVKMKAKSGSICTQPAGAAEEGLTGGDSIVTYRTRVTSLACGSGATETLTYITNANTNFRFLTPFVVEAGRTYQLDLAFNMDGAVKGIVGSPSTLNDGTDGFYVPMVRMVPSPRSASSQTKVESYTLVPTGSNGVGNFKIRAELTYDSADTTKAPLSILATVLAGTDTTKDVSNKSVGISSASITGSEIVTNSWAGSAGLTFTRSAEGTGTTGTITCSGHGDDGASFIAAPDLCTAGTVTLEDTDGPTTYTLE